ncbi:MAG: hypothetical protein LBJ13_00590, partial [Puniceicoccales bacterium]|nr:hypothetical protein [Puniceicoccales bacterium]
MNTINNNILRSIIYLALGNMGSIILGSEELTNAEKFRKENPIVAEEIEMLPRINQSDVRNKGKKLGEGGFGEVYAYTIGKGDQKREIIVKLPKDTKYAQKSIKIEIDAGEKLMDRFYEMQDDSLFSDYQGLPILSLPVRNQGNHYVALQDKINGVDGVNAIAGTRSQLPLLIFRNGFVVNPRKAIELLTELVLGLYALHRAGKVHHDLKLENIMFEIQQFLEGEYSLGEYRIRIIDLGGAVNIGAPHGDAYSLNGAPEYISPRPEEEQDSVVQPSYDIYSLGTMLPTLLFGQAIGNRTMLAKGYQVGIPSPFVQTYRKIEDGLVEEKMLTIKLSRKYIRKDPEVQDALQNRMREDMLRLYVTTNLAMQKETGKAYSDREVETLARLTADCLSLDPSRRPSAQEILETLTELLVQARSDGYTFQSLTEGERKSLGLTPKDMDEPDLSPEQLQNLIEGRKARDREML